MSNQSYFTAAARGTECYRAPEILCENKVTPASDLWSLGCILFELYCGKRAFSQDQEVWAYYKRIDPQPSVEKSDIAPNTALDAYVSAMVSNLLGRDWRKRPSANELRHVLKNLSKRHHEVYQIDSEFSEDYYLIGDAGPSDEQWKCLQWKRFWYMLS